MTAAAEVFVASVVHAELLRASCKWALAQLAMDSEGPLAVESSCSGEGARLPAGAAGAAQAAGVGVFAADAARCVATVPRHNDGQGTKKMQNNVLLDSIMLG